MTTYEQRLNASAMRMANASARLVGGFDDFPVIFDRSFVQTDTGASAARPLATALDAAVVSVQAHSTRIEVSGAPAGNGTYLVLDLQPDGTGLTVLVLEAC